MGSQRDQDELGLAAGGHWHLASVDVPTDAIMNNLGRHAREDDSLGRGDAGTRAVIKSLIFIKRLVCRWNDLDHLVSILSPWLLGLPSGGISSCTV